MELSESLQFFFFFNSWSGFLLPPSSSALPRRSLGTSPPRCHENLPQILLRASTLTGSFPHSHEIRSPFERILEYLQCHNGCQILFIYFCNGCLVNTVSAVPLCELQCGGAAAETQNNECLSRAGREGKLHICAWVCVCVRGRRCDCECVCVCV